MKIIWLNHRDIENPRSGGAERTIQEIGKRLTLRGHELHLFTGGWKGSASVAEVDGITIHRFGGKLIPHLVLPMFLHSNRDADVIVDDMAHAAPWFSPWVSSSRGTVFFHHLHQRTLRGQTSFPLALVLREFERAYPRIYRSWPFVTESLTSESDLQALGIDPRRITRIPPGVDLARFRIIQKTERPQLVYFGGMRPYKRPEHALHVMRQLISRGLKPTLVMVGSGPSLQHLMTTADRLGIVNDVMFTGRLGPQELAHVVGESWVNVNCSISEGWCFSATEAAAAGTPTVAYSVPGLTEAVQMGINGILVRDGDITSLTNAAEDILTSPFDWKLRCRSHAEKYSWDTTASMWEHHLKRVSRYDPILQT